MRFEDEHTSHPPAVHVIRLTRALAIRLTIYGSALLYLALLIALNLYPAHTTGHFGSLRALLWLGTTAIASAVGSIALHEAIHGLFMWLFGGRPRFGVALAGWVMPYAYAVAPGAPFTLRQVTVIALAPFVLISSAAGLAMWLVPSVFGIAAVAFVTNVSGSIGDLWMTARMWRFRMCRDLVLIDARDSISIHTADSRGAVIAAALDSGEPDKWVARLALRAILATSIMLTVAAPLGIALSILNAPNVTIGPTQFPLVVYGMMGGKGFSIELNTPAIVAAGVLLAVLSLPIRRRTRRAPVETTGAPRPAFL